MKVIVTDRETMERGLLVRSSYVVISICDPRRPKARIPRTSGLRDILYLSFSDAAPAANLALPREIRIMTVAQARTIWAFVERHKDIAGAIVVHCHQGMSRSPAVAAAIAHYLGLDERRFWQEHQPNQFIYDLMLQTMPGRPV